MAVLRKRPWEKGSTVKEDQLYAVKSLVKDAFMQVDGTMLKYGEWKLDVREWEVQRKGLLKSKDCVCMLMSEYSGEAEPVKKEKEKPPEKEEPKKEEDVPDSNKEEEKPKKRRARKKKKKAEEEESS